MSIITEVVSSKCLKLKSSPTRSIIIAEFPIITVENFNEVKSDIQFLISYLRENKVKFLLVDVRKSEIKIPVSDYSAFVAWCNLEFLETRLEKVARAIGPGQENDARFFKDEVHAYDNNFCIPFRDFLSFREAYSWLSLPV